MRSAPASSSPRTAAEIGSPVPLERLVGGIELLRAQGDFGAGAAGAGASGAAGAAGPMITSVTHDSRAVGPGALFCCLVGARTDGHEHAPAAVAAGAVALLCERPLALEVPQVIVRDARAAMAHVAAAFFGHPSRQMSVVGITGTNGKTTATHLLQAILEADGRHTAVIGTLSGAHTTPESTELQARLAQLAAEATDAVSMEVSSHALVQHRVDAMWFEVVAFINLSHDHLDYHRTMEEYFTAKASLFDPARARVGVVNVDDPWGRRLCDTTRLAVRPFSHADAVGLEIGRDGSTFLWQGVPVHLRLSGDFNVVNALAAAASARELGVEPAAVADGLGALGSVPGRFERVDGGGPVAVIVDYAHTPAGLEHVLSAARGLAADAAGGDRPGRVLVVFGAGGDRDRAKRPAMGEAATRLADVAVLTSDNPRNEDPMAIIEEVRAGVPAAEGRAAALVVEPDRRAAIGLAVAAARPGDVVVIAGKGHEPVQVWEGGRAVPFDDRQVAREALAG